MFALVVTRDGPRLWTAFAKVAPELGDNHALQLGVSYAHATQHQEVHTHSHAHDGDEDEDEEEEHENGLAGDADLWGIDLVYKYDAGGPYGQGDIKFQSEYLRSIKDLNAHSDILVSEDEHERFDAFYLQFLMSLGTHGAHTF